MKVDINGQGHITKMATMDINSKKKNKIFFRSRSPEAYDFQTWHEALRNGGLQNLYKSLHWDDLDLFHSKVNLDRPCI